jgi:DNA-binding transcriptional MerR regulator
VQIGQLANQVGVTVQTVRFYERKGLLPEPERRESGYRIYSPNDLRLLRFIRQAKALSFSLDEIRDILKMRGRGECPCADVIAIAQRHLRDVEGQLETLAKFRDELSRAVRTWKRSGEQTLSADAICTLIERTMDKKSKEHTG